MSLVKKYQNGKKINLYADKERSIDAKRDFGDVYDSALEGLNDEERVIAKSYIDTKLKPAIESSGAEFKYDDSGLLLNLPEGVDLGPENKKYTRVQVKSMFDNKKDRESFIKRQNIIAKVNKSVLDNIGSKISGLSDQDEQTAETNRTSAIINRFEELDKTSKFMNHYTGQNLKSGLDVAVANLDFAKKDESERSNALIDWTKKHASNILNINPSDKDEVKAFKDKTGLDLNDVQSKLKQYKSGLDIEVNKENLNNIASIIGTKMTVDTYSNKENIARWLKSGESTKTDSGGSEGLSDISTGGSQTTGAVTSEQAEEAKAINPNAYSPIVNQQETKEETKSIAETPYVVQMGESLPSAPKNGSTPSDIIDKIKDKDIDLSDSDWADLTELGLNVASAITGVTGFSPAAAGLGAAATTSGLYSAISKGEDTWSAIGNAALGYGLDALSLIPYAGTLASTAKVGKVISKSAKALKTLGYIATAAGLKELSVTISKAINDPSSMTVKDWGALANGITTLAAGRRGVGLAPNRRLSVNIGGKQSTITLDADEAKLLSKSADKINDAKLIISKKLNIKPDDVDLETAKKLTMSKGKWNMPTVKKQDVPKTGAGYINPDEKAGRGILRRAVSPTFVYRSNYNKWQNALNKSAPANQTKPTAPSTPTVANAAPVQNVSVPKPVTTVQAVTKPQSVSTSQEVIANQNSPVNTSKQTNQVNKTNNNNKSVSKENKANQNRLRNKERILNQSKLLSKAKPLNNNRPLKRSRILNKNALSRQYGGILLKDETMINNIKEPKLILKAQFGASALVGPLASILKGPNTSELDANNENKSKLVGPLASKVTRPDLLTIDADEESKKILERMKNSIDLPNIKTAKIKKWQGLNTKPIDPEQPKKSLFDAVKGLDPVFMADLGRLALNQAAVANYDKTIHTPSYSQMAEVYSAPIDTSTRDFYTNEAGKVMSGYKPQTSDALMNDRILRARQAESRNLRYQGQADYASKVAQKRATDLELSKGYSEARSKIANMNIGTATESANKGVQLNNLVAGQAATNLDTFISRWQAKKQQDDLANKSINQQMALSDIDTQMNTDMQSLQIKMNQLISKEQTPEVIAQRAKLNEQYSKLMGLKKQASYAALKNPNTKFDYMAAKQQAGISSFKKGGSLVNYITRLDRFNERQISKINSNMDKKYLMNVKNNLEILKEILKGK